MTAGGTAPGTASATIVCGLDGSPGSVELARIAGDVAAGIDAEVEFVHVIEGGPWAEDDPEALSARSQAQAMLDSLRDASGRASRKAHLMAFGETPYWIASAARSSGAQLIVIGGSSERKGAAVIGPAASRLAVASPCPVLVIPSVLAAHVHPDRWSGRTFVCGYDGSTESWNAALHVGRLASWFGSSLQLVAVGPGAPNMAPAAARLSARLAVDGYRLPSLDWEVLCGDPAYELERAARALTAPVLAIGSHGAGSDEPVLGSVAWQLLVTSKRSVLVVPATTKSR